MGENNDIMFSSGKEPSSAAQSKPSDFVQPFTRDASYELLYQEDGVYLQFMEEVGAGIPLNPSIVTYDLNRRNITGLDISNVLVHIRRRESLIKIAEQQDENTIDSDVVVVVSKDAMSAHMTLLPPSPSGKLLSFDEIMQKIKEQWGVVYGIDEEAVLRAIESGSYFKPVLIASGKPAKKGADGYLNFLFKKEHSYTPTIGPDGSADYKQLDLFESVTEGAPVVVKVPPEQGEDGCTVKGEAIPAKPGLEPKLPAGKNTRVSEDGQCLLAAKSGRIDFINGRVEVSDIYKIPGDVDMSVGNIKFEGDVIIRGNVITGLTVQASGSIEVSGYVEGATLISSKDIILKNGIKGQDVGKLIAGGNIVAKFMENCTVEARGNIVSDYIVHCNMLAGNSITMKGKWGKIIGGHIRAGKEVTANMIGSPSYDPMVIELGVAPEIRAKYVEADTRRTQLKAQLMKIDSLSRLPSSGLSPDRLAMRQKVLDSREQIEQQYNEAVDELASYEEILSRASGGRVNATKCVYPGVKIIIDSAVFITKSTFDYVTFKNRGGEIIFPSCEVMP
jgi:uncharacterized protein (DUF342 family)